MKIKSFVAAFVAVFVCTAALADSKIVNGDAEVLRNPEIQCSVSFDFTNTSVEDIPYEEYLEKKGEKFRGEWFDELIPAGLNAFEKSWNNKNKKGLQVNQEAESEYRMVLAPSYLNLGDGAMSAIIGFGAGGDKFYGTISIYKGDELLLQIDVKNQTGRSYNISKKRFANLMQELASDTLKQVLK